MSSNKARDQMRERLEAAQAAADVKNAESTPRPVAGIPMSPVAQSARDFRVGLETQRDQLLAENEELRARGLVDSIDSAKIHRTIWCNRHTAAFADAKFRQLRDDIKATGGNQQPICVRPKVGKEGEFEIAYGHRRHAACLSLGIPTNCIVRPLTDQELVGLMHWENRDRNELSAYEEGVSYQRQLDDGVYESARQLATKLEIPEAKVSKLLAFANLPGPVLEVLDDPRRLSLRMAQELRAALNRNAAEVEARLETIRATGKPLGFPARIQLLVGAKDDQKARPVEVKDDQGKPLVRAQKTPRGFQIDVFVDLTRAQLKSVVEQLSEFAKK